MRRRPGDLAGSRAFLAERRATSVHRFDTVHSPAYDQSWGAIEASHADFISRLARRIPSGGEVIDAALECVGPEDWPVVAEGLAAVLRAGAPAYLTVEPAQGPTPSPVDPRQVTGEVVEGGLYHFYPDRLRVAGWLEAADFTTIEEADSDEYWHLLLVRK